MNTSSYQKCAEDNSHYLATQLEYNVRREESILKKKEAASRGILELDWTDAALLSAGKFIELIKPSLYDDDVIADYGARDGHVATFIENQHAMPVVCVELIPEFVEKCQAAGHKALCADLEKIPLEDGAVDWAFCHHVLEHVRDLDKVTKEISRVTKRGLFLAFPIEDATLSAKNPSHMHYSMDPNDFIRPFEKLGWKRGWWDGPNDFRCDFQVFLYR